MLKLPATPHELLREVVEPAFAELPATMDSRSARCLTVAIAMQESNLEHRRQIGRNGDYGPARSPWQFEQGGIRALLTHPSTDDLVAMVCRAAKVTPDSRSIHRAIERPEHDKLACQLARINLWWHPKPLPAPELASEDEAFAYYLFVWRPGAAKTPEGRAKCAERWHRNWRKAVEAVEAAS